MRCTKQALHHLLSPSGAGRILPTRYLTNRLTSDTDVSKVYHDLNGYSAHSRTRTAHPRLNCACGRLSSGNDSVQKNYSTPKTKTGIFRQWGLNPGVLYHRVAPPGFFSFLFLLSQDLAGLLRLALNLHHFWGYRRASPLPAKYGFYDDHNLTRSWP